jgi:hypothetical protein
MSALAKVKVDVVGVAKDASFDGKDGQQVQCFEIPCSGTVDGQPSNFTVKIYGKGSDRKIVQGLEFNGGRSEYQGTVFYTLKKADNPDLYPKSNHTGGGFNKGGGFKPQHELNGLKVAAEVVIADYARCGDTTSCAEKMADEIIKIANDKFVPFLRATSERHDTVAERDENKKIQAQTIRQLIQTNNLTANVQAANATTGQLAAMYEKAGCDAAKFIQDVRVAFNAPAQPEAPADPDEYEDDIPF